MLVSIQPLLPRSSQFSARMRASGYVEFQEGEQERPSLMSVPRRMNLNEVKHCGLVAD